MNTIFVHSKDLDKKAQVSKLTKLNVSVDVGRSSIKTKVTTEEGTAYNPVSLTSYLPSIVAFSKNSFASDSNGIAQFSTEDNIDICHIPSETKSPLSGTYLFGDSARTKGENVLDFSEGEEFHKISSAVVVYQVARAIDEFAFLNAPQTYSTESGDKADRIDLALSITLAINLTFENQAFSDVYADYLKREHTVILEMLRDGSSYKCTVGFHVADVYCFYQGYVSLFTKALPQSEAEPVFSTQPGLIVDVGRRTLDLAYVNPGFQIVSGDSVELGTHNLFKELQRLVRKEGINMPLEELEALTISKKQVTSLKGNHINPWTLMRDASLREKLFNSIHKTIFNFISSRPVGYILVAGGGYHLMSDSFQKEFSGLLHELDNPVFSNAEGMDKFLRHIVHGE